MRITSGICHIYLSRIARCCPHPTCSAHPRHTALKCIATGLSRGPNLSVRSDHFDVSDLCSSTPGFTSLLCPPRLAFSSGEASCEDTPLCKHFCGMILTWWPASSCAHRVPQNL